MDQQVISQEIINLYDEFTHAPLPRRVFMDRLAKLAGGTAAAAALVPLLQNNYAQAAMVDPMDSRLDIKPVTFKGATDMKGYLAMPKGAGKLPSVVVIHENRGLNPHIEDVARRVALEGFLVLAPDFLTPLGGTSKFTSDEATQQFAKMDAGQTVANGVGAVNYLKAHANSNGKVGTVGFCWGGGMVNQLAVNSPDVAAAVVYYGIQPKPEEAAKIKAKMMIHYAGEDARINARMDEWKNALTAAKVDLQQFVYDGKQHAFNNDTAGPRYDAAAAKQAWERTIGFFKKNLA